MSDNEPNSGFKNEPDNNPKTSKTGLTVGLLLAFVAIVFSLQFIRFSESEALTPEILQNFNTVLMKEPRILQPVALVDQNNQEFKVSDFSGNWSLINFGYTHCPDVCPTNLLTLSKVRANLLSAEKPVPDIYLATVDPDRDSPDHMKSYLEFFDPGLRGLWATVPQMSDFARQLNNLFYKATDTGAYTVDHSDNIAILNKSGEFVGIFRPPHRIDDIVYVMSALMQ